MVNNESTERHGADELHLTWELSRASYLVWPRSVMQSMPDDWQGRMAALINEMEDYCASRGYEWPADGGKINVLVRDQRGKIVSDKARLYRHVPNVFGEEVEARHATPPVDSFHVKV